MLGNFNGFFLKILSLHFYNTDYIIAVTTYSRLLGLRSLKWFIKRFTTFDCLMLYISFQTRKKTRLFNKFHHTTIIFHHKNDIHSQPNTRMIMIHPTS